MYTTTALFDRRIRQGGRRKTVVDILYNGMEVALDIPVESGSIRADRTAAIRRTGSIVIPDPRLIPTFNSTLSPYGTEVRVRQGVVYPDGSEELIPLGIFILDRTTWEESEGPIPSLELVDRAMVMNRAEIGPTLDYSGWLAIDVIENLLTYFWPDLTLTTGGGLAMGRRVPGGTAFDSGDHWGIVQQMATILEGELYFDVTGSPVINAPPEFDDTTVAADAVWDVDVGDNGVLHAADRSITREETYNSIYVVGATPEDAGKVPTGHAFNTNPASPTSRNGPFRKMGKRLENNLLTTASSCQTMANNKLKEYTRLSKTLGFTCTPNPALQEGDVVQVSYLSGETELALVQNITYPLGGGGMSGSCSSARI